MIPELSIRYNHELRPEHAECSSCGQQMPPPPPDLHDNADIVGWFSRHFIEHRQQRHASPPYAGSESAERSPRKTP